MISTTPSGRVPRCAFTLVALAALTLTSGLMACNTTSAGNGSPSTTLGGTTVDNGRLVPVGVRIEYTSQGSGIDTATKKQIEDVIAEAENNDEILKTARQPQGSDGQEIECLQFHQWTAARTFHRQICGIITDGNKKAGAMLTMHEITLICDDDSVDKPLTNDQGCD